MRINAPAAALVVLCLGLAACGQKGPLYLPDDQARVVTRPGMEAGSSQPGAESGAPPADEPERTEERPDERAPAEPAP